jgi:serine/threonine protein kinase
MNDVDQILECFEQAWATDSPPGLEEFLSRCSVSSPAKRRAVLIELVKVDLQRRWSRNPQAPPLPGPLPARPLLQDYAKCFRLLGGVGQLSVDLVGEEYRARTCWGDRPGHAEYLGRYPGHKGQLQTILRQIDVELAAEQARRAGTSNAVPVPATPEGAHVHSAEAARPIDSVVGLMEALRRHSLLKPAQMKDIVRVRDRLPDARALAGELVQRRWLTAYQGDQLLHGRGADLFVGPYVILERLGEGGAGEVFKARHGKMDRLVALKLIRKELLTDAEVVARFYREIQVLGRLDHPNVVHAYDAGPGPGASHFLAMEFIEGPDLGHLVKKGGPMPVEQACAYIRQAALGLQHAHERGLVHRDIKPHNLIMSLREGLVKVADLGLARLPRPANQEATMTLASGGGTGTLTPQNAVMMGTADYLAPEQALDFHRADIRADIYSLGCTFHYLLTAQPPFPGNTLAEKLVKHQQTPPPDVGQFRKDLPATLPAVLTRMLAKQPETRFQSPAEVAAALLPFCENSQTLRDSPASVPRQLGAGWPQMPWLLAGVMLIVASLLLLLFLRPWADQPPASAQAALKEVRKQIQQSPRDSDRLRQAILRLRRDYPGTLEAAEAAVLLTLPEVPSPLDQLQADRIPAAERDPKQPRELVSVLGKKGEPAVWTVSFSPDGSLLGGGGIGAVLRIWDPANGKLTQNIDGPGNIIQVLRFLPDGHALASLTKTDETLRMWERDSGSVRFAIPTTVPAVAVAPTGKTLALAGRDHQVKLLHTADGKLDRALSGHAAPITALAFGPEDRMLASGSTDGTVILWDVATGTRRFTVHKHTDRVDSVVFSPDGRKVASASGTGERSLRIYDVATGKEELVFQGLTPLFVWAHGGNSLVGTVSSSSLRQWDLSGKQLWEVTLPAGRIMDIALAPDGRHLAAANDNGTVSILRLPPPRP